MKVLYKVPGILVIILLLAGFVMYSPGNNKIVEEPKLTGTIPFIVSVPTD